MCTPFIGVLLVSLLNLSWKRYKTLITLFRKRWSVTREDFVPIEIHWSDTTHTSQVIIFIEFIKNY